MQKRVLTIQDFSCMGRCSLTVAIPTISACKVECVALPTAILSNHTMFESWTYLDLTSQLKEIISKWMPYNHSFDFIYTGYLSNEQVETVIDIVKILKDEHTKIFIDPAMADNGKLYPGFDFKHVELMRKLIDGADYIKPNLTEACLLADIEYPGSEKEISMSFYQKIFDKLSTYGPKIIIITGQEIENGKIADIYYDTQTKKITTYVTDMYYGKFHGTGDLFSSSLVGCLADGLTLDTGVKIAHDFLHRAIKNTIDEKLDGTVYGPAFEPVLKHLIADIEKEMNN